MKQWRKKAGLTQEQVAERIGISRTNYGRIEKGQVPYNQDILEAAADALNCTPASLLMRDPTDENSIWSVVDNLQKAEPDQRRQAIAVIDTLLKEAS